MIGLTLHNVVSAAAGIAVAAAFVRALARSSAGTLGNFWVDLVRTTYYLLLPGCLVFAVFLVSQGMIQNFKPYTQAKLVEPFQIAVEKKDSQGATVKGADGKPVMENQTVGEQVIAQGPMASQVAIKMLGTNGGGFMNANAAHPFENPTPLSNFLQMLSIFAIGSGLTYYLGRMTKNQAHGWSVWGAMMILPILGLAGSLGRKPTAPPNPGTFPVSGFTFLILLVGTVLLLGALNFLPVLALGPIVEHFLTAGGTLWSIQRYDLAVPLRDLARGALRIGEARSISNALK